MRVTSTGGARIWRRTGLRSSKRNNDVGYSPNPGAHPQGYIAVPRAAGEAPCSTFESRFVVILLLVEDDDVVHCLTLGVRALRRHGHGLPVLRNDPSEGRSNFVTLLVSAVCRTCVDAL